METRGVLSISKCNEQSKQMCQVKADINPAMNFNNSRRIKFLKSSKWEMRIKVVAYDCFITNSLNNSLETRELILIQRIELLIG